MADSSQASSAVDARAVAQEILGRLPVDLEGLPKEVLSKLEERARAPDRRLIIGRYLVCGELGRGGMGVVYDAWDPGIERRVAIKTIEPDLVPEEDRDEVIERFRRETKIVGRLHHPGIVTIFDYGEERDAGGGVAGSKLYYYVMEYLEGQSLARLLRERRTMSDVAAVTIVTEILDALAVSHSAGVIHRDIKPSNIFLRGGQEAVLLDFGIAKTGSVALTRQGQILGTPSYLAPERLREKESPVDGRADIFSLGVLLFTMITGDAPFVGEDVYDVIDKIAKTAHPKLARSTPSGQALSRVIDRMLAKKPEDRYPSAAEAAVALRGVLKLLREHKPSTTDDLFVQGVQIREELPENAATEIATPSNALPALIDDDVDTGRHSVQVRDVDGGTNRTRPPPLVAGVRGNPLATTIPEDELPHSSVTPMDESAQMIASGPQMAKPSPSGPQQPIRAAELFGTRPDLALQRETRELDNTKSPKKLPPPLPVRTLLTPRPDSTNPAESSAERTYDSHAEHNDENTDDQTVADPDAGRRGAPEMSFRSQPPQPLSPSGAVYAQSSPSGAVRAQKSPSGPNVAISNKSPAQGTPSPISARNPLARGSSKPAIERGPPTGEQHVVRAASPDHAEQKTENARPTVRASKTAPARVKRSRIEASLVDEDDVVVKPAPLDALKPDELPTQAAFRVPPAATAALAEDVVSSIADPAEGAREEPTQGGVMLKEDSGETPELDIPRSAAVARKTFGARGDEKAKPKSSNKSAPIHVRMIGNVGSTQDRMRVVRRRGFMLLAAMLAAIAVGLLLGRLKQRGGGNDAASDDPNKGVIVEPRAMKSVPETTQGEPAIVKPPPAAEILQEASAALAEGKLEKAERLFDSAVRASSEKNPIRAQAMLGRADVLRQLGKKEQAIELYRTLLAEAPKSTESENARVALTELGVDATAPIKRPQPTNAALTKKEVLPKEEAVAEPEPPPQKPAMREITASMSPEEKCLTVISNYLNDRPGAVKALIELSRDEPRIGCVYWHLGNSYRQMGDDRAALSAYRRFIELDPNSPRKNAVEQKIKDLATKLEER